MVNDGEWWWKSPTTLLNLYIDVTNFGFDIEPTIWYRWPKLQASWRHDLDILSNLLKVCFIIFMRPPNSILWLVACPWTIWKHAVQPCGTLSRSSFGWNHWIRNGSSRLNNFIAGFNPTSFFFEISFFFFFFFLSLRNCFLEVFVFYFFNDNFMVMKQEEELLIFMI